jgi:acetone carboxylase gamma subunit
LKELFKEERTPVTEEEQKEFAQRIQRIKRDNCMLWTLVPHFKQWLLLLSKSRIKMFCGSNQCGKTTIEIEDALSYCLGYRPWLLHAHLNARNGKRSFEDRFTYTYQDLNDETVTVKPPKLAKEFPVLTYDGQHFDPKNVVMAGKDFSTFIMGVFLPKIEEMIPLDYTKKSSERIHSGVIHRINWPNGSMLKFLSYDQDDDKFEGYTAHRILCDEPPPRDKWVAMKRGGMKHDAQASMFFTPLTNFWTFDEIYSPGLHLNTEEDATSSNKNKDRITVVTISLDENPYISREAKKEFIDSLNDEDKEARVHGRYRHLLGRVYKQFDKSKHVLSESRVTDIVQPEWPVLQVVDPHSRRPYAVGWCAISPTGDRYWIHEWPEFEVHKVKQWRWGVSDYKYHFRRAEAGSNPTGNQLRVEWRFMDPNFGRTKSAETSLTLQEAFEQDHDLSSLRSDDNPETDERLAEYGRSMFFECDFSNNIEERHILVKEALQNNSLFVSETCKNIINMFEFYAWSEFKTSQEERAAKEAPQEIFKDFADVVGYGQVNDVSYFDETDMSPTGGATWESMLG